MREFDPLHGSHPVLQFTTVHNLRRTGREIRAFRALELEGLCNKEATMTTLRKVIVYIVERRPSITDRQLTEAVYGSDDRHQQVNAECRSCPEIERWQGEMHIGN
jgi:hypothetical protein